MLHNARVSGLRFRWLLPSVLAAVLAACEPGSAPQRAPAAAGTLSDHLAWQGIVACADCMGIDTRLQLDEGAGITARYELVEAFLDSEGAQYFREAGRWERTGAVLVLRADGGGVRRYRIDGDGNLAPADFHGDVSGASGLLAPVADAPQGL